MRPVSTRPRNGSASISTASGGQAGSSARVGGGRPRHVLHDQLEQRREVFARIGRDSFTAQPCLPLA